MEQVRPFPRDLLVPREQAERLKAAARDCKSIALAPRQADELELLLSGAYAPLTGFLGQADFESVLDRLRLADGTPWPLPVSLGVPERLAETLALGERVVLRDGEGFPVAVLTVTSVFRADPKREIRAVFGGDEPSKHPGAAALLREFRAWRVGGPVAGFTLPGHGDFTALRRPPAALRAEQAARGWSAVLGAMMPPFPHRGDQAVLLEAAERLGLPLLLLHPAGDALAPGIAHFAAVRCAAWFAARLPWTPPLFGLVPYRSLGAGPRQALLEAILHRNSGCTHFLVSRHHADPLATPECAGWYPAGAAQRLVAAFADEIGIAMVAATPMAYVADLGRYQPCAAVRSRSATRPLSPVEVRHRLEFDRPLPDWYAFPEVAAEMRRAFPPRSRQGFTVFLTGLSGAGKSTLAKLLYVTLMERNGRPVTLLDGDIVRRHLSSELTFSKAHRNLNIERIGFVAGEITKNGGIAICAPIAPYASSRDYARAQVERSGGFIEVHVATPLTVCERRDPKGLYAKARAGLLTGVTGIDDPYEPPENAEIVLDTSRLSPTAALRQVLSYLELTGYLERENGEEASGGQEGNHSPPGLS